MLFASLSVTPARPCVAHENVTRVINRDVRMARIKLSEQIENSHSLETDKHFIPIRTSIERA
jgi:hypothetical protein